MSSLYEKNLRQIVNLTFRLISDYRGDYKNGRVYTVQEMIKAVNDTLVELVLDTGLLKDVSLIIPTDGTQTYSLPANCLRPLRLKLNGIDGTLILPKQRSQYDYERDPFSDEGDPVTFHRDDALAWNQIGFLPTPSQDGSSAATDSGGDGILRRISDGSNNLTFDANRPLRRILGAPIEYGGDGRVVRGVAASGGNIQVHYVRVPAKMSKHNDLPDSDFPVWLHKDIKWGAAARITRGSKIPVHALKGKLARIKWQGVRMQLISRCYDTGPISPARPA